METDIDRLLALSKKLRSSKDSHLVEYAAGEIERLRRQVLDACKVFDHYDLPEHAFHYRRDILGLEQAKTIARDPAHRQER